MMPLRRALLAAAAVVLATPTAAAAADRTIVVEGQIVRDPGTGYAVTSLETIGGGEAVVEQSADGSRLALGNPATHRQWQGELQLTTADGACRRKVPGVDGIGDLSWAPDSVRLAIVSSGVEIVDSGDPELRRRTIPGTASVADGVAWHPSTFVDLLAISIAGDIHLATPGGLVRPLVAGPGEDRQPAWSRDGEHLAFVRTEPDGSRRLHVARADGTGARPVAAAQLVAPQDPRWTRDGRIFVADKEAGGSAGVWAVDPMAGTAIRITSGVHRSPDDAPLGPRHGYVVVAADGRAHGFGASCSDPNPTAGAVAAAANPTRPGHYQVTASGVVSARGAVPHLGDLAGRRLNQPIVGIAATPSGGGYWLVARDGGIFSFGDAVFHGSTGAMRLNQPIVGMAATPTGRGYWLVAGDGGIFSFGDAVFHGSTGAMRLNQPIVGLHRTDSGRGYWLVARDGGIFSFGDAVFAGSTGAMRLNQPIVGMGKVPGRAGYWLVAGDGGIFSFGEHRFLGSTGGIRIAGPAAGMVVETISGS